MRRMEPRCDDVTLGLQAAEPKPEARIKNYNVHPFSNGSTVGPWTVTV